MQRKWELLRAIIFFLYGLNSPIFAAHHHQVVVVGAGLGGLSAAYYLNKQGIEAYIFEARERAGGRVHTTKIEGINASFEQGGAFVDSDHDALIELTKELQCPLLRVINDEKMLYYQFIDGELCTSQNNFSRFLETLLVLENDRYNKELKHISIANYLANKKAPRALIKLINLTFNNEFGSDISEMRADELFKIISLNICEAHFMTNGQLGDEAFIIKGGGAALVSKLEGSLKIPVQYEHELSEMSREKDQYLLSFKTKEGIKKISSKYVIMTVPPEVLHENVNLAGLHLPLFLQTFITRRHSGHNIKTCLYFSEPCWRKLDVGNRFNFLTEHFWIWDNSDYEQGNSIFGLVAFAGGSNALRATSLSDNEIEKEILDALTFLLPTIRSYYLFTIRGHDWLKDPFARGSYAGIIAPGDDPIKEAYERPYDAHLSFAGSAWSEEFEGFMNGAVVSGKRAAQEVIDDIEK